MKHFVPHALIAFALIAFAAETLPEHVSIATAIAGHLLAPIWSAALARPGARLRAALLGPGTIIGVHALALAVTVLYFIGDRPEDVWAVLMMCAWWAAGLAAYLVYCAIAFSLTARRRRR